MNENINKSPIVYSDLREVESDSHKWGSEKKLFHNWGELKLKGLALTINQELSYATWADSLSENIVLVEKGNGKVVLGKKEYLVEAGYAFKVFPGQEPVIVPKGSMEIFSVQMPSSEEMAKKASKDLNSLEVVNVTEAETKVYEYEALAQEIFMPEVEPSLGLITFIFPIRDIPFHIHPNAGRVIRTISGQGYTYAEPNVYEMNENTFALFPKGTIHTNGPIPGSVYRVYAFQLPFVKTGITSEDIAGSPNFVQYVGSTPPKELWKKKEDFERVIDRLEK